ncbi:hypothetical protein COD66_26265 [Bacillus cereus]|nr:hypothetical protein COD66_26265 [Bacillus cereus]
MSPKHHKIYNVHFVLISSDATSFQILPPNVAPPKTMSFQAPQHIKRVNTVSTQPPPYVTPSSNNKCNCPSRKKG